MTDFPTLKVEQILGTHFRDPMLLAIAFGRSGTPRFAQGRALTQKMLAYLGDALIEVAMRKWVLIVHGQHPERWADWRAHCVSNRVLAKIVCDLNLDSYATTDEDDHSEHALGTVFEAIVAAVNIDRGSASTENFLVRHYLRHFAELIRTFELETGIPSLMNEVRELIGSEPTFSQPSKPRSSKRKPFVAISCFVSGEFLSRGEGKTETDARVSALRNAAAKLRLVAPWTDVEDKEPAHSFGSP